MTQITIQDTAALGYCRRGTREFFERHNLDWHRFRKEGLPVDDFEGIDDEMVVAAIRQARLREAEQ